MGNGTTQKKGLRPGRRDRLTSQKGEPVEPDLATLASEVEDASTWYHVQISCLGVRVHFLSLQSGLEIIIFKQKSYFLQA